MSSYRLNSAVQNQTMVARTGTGNCTRNKLQTCYRCVCICINTQIYYIFACVNVYMHVYVCVCAFPV